MHIYREEFDQIDDLETLRSFSCDISYDGQACRLVTEDELDREIDGRISDYLISQYWYSLIEVLGDIERGYDWYVDNGSLDYNPVYDEARFFREEKENLLEFIYENGGFEDEEPEDERLEDKEEEEDEDNFDASCTADMLLSACC